jgi:hypothetical protein
MTADEVDQALSGLAAERARLMKQADVPGLRALKHKEVDLRGRLSAIRVANLKLRVDTCKADLEHAIEQQGERNAWAHDEAERARADAAEAEAQLMDAQKRLTIALSTMDTVVSMADGARGTLRQAEQELEAALRALIDS